MTHVHSGECKVVFRLRFLSFVHFQYFSILKKCNIKKCNMRKVQHGKCATWKKCNMENVQHEKSATRKSATKKKCNMERVQYGNSRSVTRTPQTSLQQYLMVLLIIVGKLSILDVCGAPGYISGKSATQTKCNRKILLHKKSATWKECNMKKHKLPQWNTEKVHKGSVL